MPITSWWRNIQTFGWFVAGALFVALSGCGSDELPPFEVEDDQIAPSAVMDLRVDSRDDSTLVLLWTSPGDDGTEGRAWFYDMRRHSEPIDDENWDEATTINGEPAPSPSGRTEVFIILRLGAVERYFFALRTHDEWDNISDLSNVAEADPLDRIAPGRITDLAATAVGPLEVELSWTATGDDGGEGRAFGYLIRMAEFELNEENFPEGTVVSPSPVPRTSGEPETFRISLGDEGAARTVWFGMQAWDELNQSGPVSNFVRVDLSGTLGRDAGMERGRTR